MPNSEQNSGPPTRDQPVLLSPLEKVVTPCWLRCAIPIVTWRKKAAPEKRLYLTFDDGPTAAITDQLLSNLKEFDARATFFCIGENAAREPDRLAAIVDQGHLIGNHSHSHPNGWRTGSKDYVADVARCQDLLTDAFGHAPKYFRPPYGRISISQLMRLRRRFEIVMWDILSLDYRPELTGEEVAENVTLNAKPGSIVLLHDSPLAADRVTVALPKILQYFSEHGFQFCTLDQ